MSQIPKDPVILLSYVNTQLRDFYSALDEFCCEKDVPREEVESALKAIGYTYDPEENQFR